MVLMKRVKVIEFGRKGNEYDFKIPAGTSVSSIEQALALFIIDNAKYRKIGTQTVLAEISQWVQQLEDNL
jgi:hypothetical protein